MTASANVRYQIDASDRIAAVNEGWIEFARANSGDRLLPPAIVGHSLWDSISDPTTTQIYRAIVNRVRKGAGPAQFRFRCDSPAMRRLLEMRIKGGERGAVDFETSLIESQPRPVVALMDVQTPRSDALITICAWCMKIEVPGHVWLEIEAAAATMGLFESAALPHLSHGMCPDCYDAMMGVVVTV